MNAKSPEEREQAANARRVHDSAMRSLQREQYEVESVDSRSMQGP